MVIKAKLSRFSPDQQRAAEKLTFDRDELSDKTLAKLRAVLNDEQSQRLGITREAKSQ